MRSIWETDPLIGDFEPIFLDRVESLVSSFDYFSVFKLPVAIANFHGITYHDTHFRQVVDSPASATWKLDGFDAVLVVSG